MWISAQNLDLTKPNYTLRVATDHTSPESVEVKRDTERVDQIKSMKKAWEMTDPGRFEKVAQINQREISNPVII